MCGLIGAVFNKNCNIKENLSSGLKTLVHRGPDELGSVLLESGKKRTYLGHARLSILDIEGGKQPMVDESNTLFIIYNGEIYNHRELRKELEKKFVFRTDHSDTEVILYAYREYGEACFEMFDGMFAIALYDAVEQKIILARDRFGIKPLLFYFSGDTFLFASEIKAMLCVKSVQWKLEHRNLQLCWINDNIPAPYSAFKNTYKIMPGEIVTYDILKHKIDKRKYYRYLRKNEIVDYNQAYHLFRETLPRVVKRYTCSDVEVAAFLSGGVDSSLLVCELVQQGLINRVFHIPSKHNPQDTHDARNLARHLDVEIIEDDAILRFDLQYARNVYEKIDEPYFDTSIIPTSMVSRLAQSNGVKVILTGDGLDELAGGYPQFKTFYWNSLLSKRRFLRFVYRMLKEIDFKNMMIPYIDHHDERSLIEEYRNNQFRFSLEKIDTFSNSGEFIDTLRPIDGKSEKLMDYISCEQVENFMVNDVLFKVDSASMQYSVECRVPYLSNAITDLISRIEFSVLMKHSGKSLMKRMLKVRSQGIVNPYVKKRGFSIDYGKILKSKEVWEFIHDVSQDCPFINQKIRENIHPLYTESQITSKMVWRMIAFLFWWDSTGKVYV